ncbi:hypothetical protein BGZ82_010206 [Podila clonocystis]|nr:hypothetical protein BGZ82_010206 [Podila clonocystis]
MPKPEPSLPSDDDDEAPLDPGGAPAKAGLPGPSICIVMSNVKMLIPLAATVFAVSAAASSAPRGLGFARTASTEQQMFYTARTWNPSGNVLYSLDLTVPWPVSTPTWTKLPFNVPDELGPFTTDTLALSSNGSKLHFLSNTKRGSYDPLSAEWTVSDRPRYHDLLGVFRAVVSDTDDDVLYALEENIDYAVSEEVMYSMENEGDLNMDWLPKADTLLRLNMKNDTLSRERISDVLEYRRRGVFTAVNARA